MPTFAVSALLAVLGGVVVIVVGFVPYVAWSYRRRGVFGFGHAFLAGCTAVYALALWTYSKNIIASAWYETGRCKLKLSKGREAMEAFRTVFKEYPDSDKVRDSLFLIGNILEQARQNDKALAYYKKVAAMSSGDSIGQKAESRIRELQKQAG